MVVVDMAVDVVEVADTAVDVGAAATEVDRVDMAAAEVMPTFVKLAGSMKIIQSTNPY